MMNGQPTHIKLNKDLREIRSVYFIGIGGIGMSALARYFHERGVRVSGYDRTRTPLTIELEKEGVSISYEDKTELLDKEADVVVYTPAVPAGHAGLNYYRDHRFTLLKRSDMLGIIANDHFSICVAGTHGKTTTSTMIAHILRDSGYGCNAFLGGISVNYSTNYWSDKRQVAVCEADEYDRSFLKLDPDVAVITSMDPDHLDIYGTEENMQDAFVAFSERIRPGGMLVCHTGLPRDKELHAAKKLTYSLSASQGSAYAKNIQVANGRYVFDVVLPEREITGIQLQMGGAHNIENAVASVAVADHLQIDAEKIRRAVGSFKGVKRRFEWVPAGDDTVLIDDYAHHPGELSALIQGIRQMYPGKKCSLIFQPHLYSRTKDLASGFAASLDEADEIILLPVYPAREMPIPGVSSAMIAAQMKNKNVHMLEKNELVDWVVRNKPSLLVMAGAGDIDMLVEPVSSALNEKAILK
jgi:UDP-N-acetylmuramate--alanine ligase